MNRRAMGQILLWLIPVFELSSDGLLLRKKKKQAAVALVVTELEDSTLSTFASDRLSVVSRC